MMGEKKSMLRVGFSKTQMAFLAFMFLAISCATYATMGQYVQYYTLHDAAEYNKVYSKGKEQSVNQEMINEDMQLPVTDQEEQRQMAMKNTIRELLKDGIQEEDIQRIQKEISDKGEKTPEKIDEIITEITGMSRVYLMFYDAAKIRKGTLNEFREYVSDQVAERGHIPLVYKYVEFFLLYSMFAMIVYGTLRYKKYCDPYFTDNLTYRDQMTVSNLFLAEFLPILTFGAAALMLNSLFYLGSVGMDLRDLKTGLFFPLTILVQIFFVCSLCLFVNYITKKWLVSDVLVVLLIFYSNSSVQVSEVETSVPIKPLSILIRYDKPFFENFQKANWVANDLLLLVAGGAMLFGCSFLLKKQK